MNGRGPTDDAYVANFARRVAQDAYVQAEARYWLSRAKVFEDAAPRAGDYSGLATDAELWAARVRCWAVADACRARAAMGRDVS